MTSGRKFRVDIDPESTLRSALGEMGISIDEFLWIVRCDDPATIHNPPSWWFMILYYLMRRCAEETFPGHLRGQVNTLSQRIYSRAWRIANQHRTVTKKTGVGQVSPRHDTQHGELTIPEAAAMIGCHPSTLHRRMGKGLSLEEAMHKPRYSRASVIPCSAPTTKS